MGKLISSFCLVALMGFSASSLSAQTQAPAAKPKPAAAAHTGTDTALLHPATMKAQAPAEYDVKFVTTKGDFVIHVTRAWAPLGADRFYNLVKHHFYDGASFFRFVDGFVVQFGLTGSPAVNKAWTDANIKDDPVKASNKAGYITFADGRQRYAHHAGVHQPWRQYAAGCQRVLAVWPGDVWDGCGEEPVQRICRRADEPSGRDHE